ncbi:MAG: FAD binding domain-containing protein [Acidimicrobiales bacterium]
MKPPPFSYAMVDTLDEACDLIHDDSEAKILAGGQSLVPLLSMRLAQPTVVVDIQQLDALQGIDMADHDLRIGAMTTHARLEKATGEDSSIPMLAEAARHIAHPQIRNRGTVGGSLAHADPAGEWPVVMLALDATVAVRSVLDAHTVPIDELFAGPYMTTLAPDEIVTDVYVPLVERAWSFQELARRVGDFGLCLVAVALDITGRISTDVRIAVGGATTVACRASEAESALNGMELSDVAISGAAQIAGRSLPLTSDIHGSAEYRRQLVQVLVERALRDARQKQR